MNAKNHYMRGAALVLCGGLCLSSGGLIVRYIEAADGWKILFYRAISFALTVLIFLLLRYRRDTIRHFLGIGWPGAIAAIALGFGFIFYLFGILLTNVANVVFIISAGPFLAALLAWLLLREPVRKATVAAMLAALSGVGLMFADGLSGGHLLGNLIALGTPVCFAVMVVAMRSGRSRDMVPAIFYAGLIAMLLSYLMLDDLTISTRDLLLSLLLGSVQVGFGFILITLGTRWVPSAQVALLSLTETVFAPIWVWLFVGEVPSVLALAGGVILILAVAGQAFAGMRSRAA